MWTSLRLAAQCRCVPVNADGRPLDMAILIYEVWEQPDETGKMLPGLVLAGLDGDAFRRILEPGARLMIRFKATSHFQAMTTYYQLVGYGEYFNDEPWSHEPHTQEEADRQASRRSNSGVKARNHGI